MFLSKVLSIQTVLDGNIERLNEPDLWEGKESEVSAV